MDYHPVNGIVLDLGDATRRHRQVYFASEEKRGRLRLIISPEGKDGSLAVHRRC